MPRGTQARTAVQRWAEPVSVALLGRAGVNGNAHPKRSDGALQLDREQDGLVHILERNPDAVSGVGEQVAAMSGGELAHQPIMFREVALHAGAVLLPPARRSLDVREAERARTARHG